MKTLLEWIETLSPCDRYKEYRRQGILTPQTTLKDIFLNKAELFLYMDQEWLIRRLAKEFRWPAYATAGVDGIILCVQGRQIVSYTREQFVAMLYEALEHIDVDIAI